MRDAKRKLEEAKREPRPKLTVTVDPGLLREAKAALDSLPGKATKGGLSGLVDRGLALELERLRHEHNGGKEFGDE